MAGRGPTGARLTLTFRHDVPELTGKEVEALLAPLISFEVKTPIQAFTDTLPPKLKQAILDHHVMVGMSTDMVLFAKGHPENKIREMEGQMPIEIWVYGKPPEDVDFVRINGNRVIRVEVAAVGKPAGDFYQGRSGRDDADRRHSVDAANPPTTHTIQMGDVQRNPDTQAPAAPPSLRNPGETLPADNGKDRRVGVMKPVQFPKQKPDDDSRRHRTSQAPAPSRPARHRRQLQPSAADARSRMHRSASAPKPAPDGASRSRAAATASDVRRPRFM